MKMRSVGVGIKQMKKGTQFSTPYISISPYLYIYHPPPRCKRFFLSFFFFFAFGPHSHSHSHSLSLSLSLSLSHSLALHLKLPHCYFIFQLLFLLHLLSSSLYVSFLPNLAPYPLLQMYTLPKIFQINSKFLIVLVDDLNHLDFTWIVLFDCFFFFLIILKNTLITKIS